MNFFVFNHWNFLHVDFLWRPRQIWGVFSNAHQTLVLQRRLNCLDGAECFSNTVQSLGIWSRRRFVFYVSGLRRWSWGKTQTCFGCRPLLFLVVERFYVLLQNAFMFWLRKYEILISNFVIIWGDPPPIRDYVIYGWPLTEGLIIIIISFIASFFITCIVPHITGWGGAPGLLIVK